MLQAMYTLFLMYRCYLGYFGVWFWILNLFQTEQVFTLNSGLFSLLSKRMALSSRGLELDLFFVCSTDASSFGTLLKPELNNADLLTFIIKTQWGKTQANYHPN